MTAFNLHLLLFFRGAFERPRPNPRGELIRVHHVQTFIFIV